MDAFRETMNLWNWLPGFRAVAETEHLPTASERVRVTPAALSRTVKLLEQELGRELFARRGRRLVLNDDGRALAGAVREAMRRVHDTLLQLEGATLAGAVRIAAGGVSQVFAHRALTEIRRAYPRLVPHLLTPRPATAASDLLRGDLDLIVASFVIRAEGIETQVLGHDTNGIYCGPGHPLHGRQPGLDVVLEHPFAAPPADATGATPEGWPPDVGRNVGMVLDRITSGLAICGQGDLLTVLPDALAATDPRLHRLDLDIIPPTPVVAMSRTRLGSDDRVARVVDAFARAVGGP